MSYSAPVPPELEKRGITRVRDNAEGHDLVLPKGLIASYFKEDFKRFIEQKRKALETQDRTRSA